MCDCYGAKCELCDTIVPMHIGDFKFPRTAFRVWCDKHAVVAPFAATIFTLTEDETDIEPGEPVYRAGMRFAVIGPEVGEGGPGADNFPNIGVDMNVERKP